VDAEGFEARGHVLAVAVGDDGPVDVEDAAVSANVERPARCRPPPARQDAIRFCGLSLRIAEYRVLELEQFGNLAVPVDAVDAGLEESHIERPDLLDARTGRIALARSSLGVRLGKPGDDHGPDAAVVGQAVCLPVRPGQAEVRREVTGLQHPPLRTEAQRHHRREEDRKRSHGFGDCSSADRPAGTATWG